MKPVRVCSGMLTVGDFGGAEQVGGVLDVGLELSLAFHAALCYRVSVPVLLLLIVLRSGSSMRDGVRVSMCASGCA